MARYRADIETSLPPETVLGYMADFTNTRDWDPGVSDARRVDSGPIQVGSRFDLDLPIAGRTITLTYEVAELDESHVRLVARNSVMISDDRITVSAGPGATVLEYDADLSLRGPLRLADPLLKRAFRRVGDRATTGLTQAIERLERLGSVP